MRVGEDLRIMRGTSADIRRDQIPRNGEQNDEIRPRLSCKIVQRLAYTAIMGDVPSSHPSWGLWLVEGQAILPIGDPHTTDLDRSDTDRISSCLETPDALSESSDPSRRYSYL